MTLKKILNLITIFCITILLSNTNLYSQKKSKNSITFDQALHESVEYREIGPFRGGDFRPTDQDINVKNELIEKVNKQLEIYDTIISNDIPNFNSSFKNLELDYISVSM